jgi:predicted CopG family antitoxin
MGTKQIRVSEDLYARIRSENQAGETLGETLERLVGGRSLAELGNVFDEARAAQIREAVDEADDRDREEVRGLAARFQ